MSTDDDPLRAIARRLASLIRKDRGFWTSAILRWAADPPQYGDDGLLPVPLPVRLSLDEKIALLAAIHDACVTVSARVNPWRDSDDMPKLTEESINAIPVEYQLAIRYDILIKDRVRKLRQHWRTHEAAIELFIADVEEATGESSSAGGFDRCIMQNYRSLGEILLDLSRFETAQAAGQRSKATELWAKLHLDEDAGRIEGLCKGRYGAFNIETANRCCGEVSSHHNLSDYDAKRLPPDKFIELAKELTTIVSSVPQNDKSAAETDATTGAGFIERLLAGPDDVELKRSELAMLDAHLQQPVPALSQRGAKARAKKTEADRNKLTLIRDFNRNLQVAVAVDPQPTEPTAKQRGRKKADHATVQREAALAADWGRARDAGIYKPVFAKDNKMTVNQLDALLDRVAKTRFRLIHSESRANYSERKTSGCFLRQSGALGRESIRVIAPNKSVSRSAT